MFIVLVGFYGYILWTFVLSFTTSTFLPNYKWAGLAQYARLWENDRWWVASKNLALFGGMFIGITLVIGVLLAVFLDQRIRREGFIRTRSEEHTSELQSLMRISYAVLCLKKTTNNRQINPTNVISWKQGTY